MPGAQNSRVALPRALQGEPRSRRIDHRKIAAIPVRRCRPSHGRRELRAVGAPQLCQVYEAIGDRAAAPMTAIACSGNAAVLTVSKGASSA